MSSPTAALAYCALALTACGRRVDAAAMEGLLVALGMDVDRAGLAALLHLIVALGPPVAPGSPETPPPDAAPPHPEGLSRPETWQGAAAPVEDGLYLYGIAEGGGEGDLPVQGLDGRGVAPLRYRDLIVLAHACPARAYASGEQAQILDWVQAHQGVLDAALGLYESVVPFQFNVIVSGAGSSPASRLEAWMATRYADLKRLSARVRRRREYAVRCAQLGERGADPGAPALDPERPDPEPPDPDVPVGLRYLREEKRRRDEVAAGARQAHGLAESCLDALRAMADDVLVEAQRPEEDPPAFLRCACLVEVDRVQAFMAALEALERRERIGIEVTGPWPAYTFVREWAPSVRSGLL